MKLHFGHLIIRLFLRDIGDSLERSSLKQGLLTLNIFSVPIGIFGETLKNVLKKVQHKTEFIMR